MCTPMNGQSGPVGAHPSDGRGRCSNAGWLNSGIAIAASGGGNRCAEPHTLPAIRFVGIYLDPVVQLDGNPTTDLVGRLRFYRVPLKREIAHRILRGRTRCSQATTGRGLTNCGRARRPGLRSAVDSAERMRLFGEREGHTGCAKGDSRRHSDGPKVSDIGGLVSDIKTCRRTAASTSAPSWGSIDENGADRARVRSRRQRS